MNDFECALEVYRLAGVNYQRAIATDSFGQPLYPNISISDARRAVLTAAQDPALIKPEEA